VRCIIPEAPEVRTIVDELQKIIVGRDLARVQILGGRFTKTPPRGWEDFKNALGIGPLKIEKVSCKGKFIFWEFEEDWSMWCSLAMTGQWTRSKEKHSAIRFLHIKSGSESTVMKALYFDDMRHQGSIRFVKGKEHLEKRLSQLGVDMLQEDPGAEVFKSLIHKKPEHQITKVLMDQKRIAGVGNYIKADALYLAKISPYRTAGSLTDDELASLRESIRSVMLSSYKLGGHAIRDYTAGEASYESPCYGRKADSQGNVIIKEKTDDGRTTHWCPSIQV
jgi:DNA-formamidopyrimidine glycosylase